MRRLVRKKTADNQVIEQGSGIGDQGLGIGNIEKKI